MAVFWWSRQTTYNFTSHQSEFFIMKPCFQLFRHASRCQRLTIFMGKSLFIYLFYFYYYFFLKGCLRLGCVYEIQSNACSCFICLKKKIVLFNHIYSLLWFYIATQPTWKCPQEVLIGQLKKCCDSWIGSTSSGKATHPYKHTLCLCSVNTVRVAVWAWIRQKMRTKLNLITAL